MVAEPKAFNAGVIVAVRSAPVPLKTTFATGTTDSSLDVALKVRAPANVSMSPTVKVTNLGTSSSVLVSTISEIVGASFTEFTARTKQIGRASCRERVKISVVAVSLKEKKG